MATLAASIVGGVVGTGLIGWHVASWVGQRSLETPKYEVLRTLHVAGRSWFLPRSLEIRRYAPIIIAETEIRHAKNMNDAMSQGFRAVAGYIFGKNAASTPEIKQTIAMTAPVMAQVPETIAMTAPVTTSVPVPVPSDNEKIAMTAPVTTTTTSGGGETEGGVYKVAFTMPSKWTMSTLPKPLNDKVVIKQLPARTVAALAWRGKGPREEGTRKATQDLLQALAAAGVEVDNTSTRGVQLDQFNPPWDPPYMRRCEMVVDVVLPTGDTPSSPSGMKKGE